jgi:hypothetical protein
VAQTVQVWTDNLPEQRFLEAILRDRRDRGEIRIDSGLGGTSILSIGSSALLRHPDRPIALVLNTDDEDPDELHGYINRYMPFLPTWHAALATPKVDDWAMADDRVKQIFETKPHLKRDRYNRAVEIGKLVEDEPFDVESLRRISEEFRGLEDFLDRYAAISPSPKARRR